MIHGDLGTKHGVRYNIIINNLKKKTASSDALKTVKL